MPSHEPDERATAATHADHGGGGARGPAGPWSPQPPYPAYPPLPPVQAWGPPPPRRRRSRWLTIGLPLAVVLPVGGCGAAIAVLVSTVGNDIGPARDAAHAYAGALVDQRWDDAHELLCEQDWAAVTARDLATHYAQPQLTGYSIDGVYVSVVNGQKSARVDITFTTADGLTNPTTLPMTTEDDVWRPCP